MLLRHNLNYLSKYTKPLKINQYEVSPVRKVPKGIPRPFYVRDEYHMLPNIQTDPVQVLGQNQIKDLKKAAKLSSNALSFAIENTHVGMTLDDVDKLVHEFICKNGGYPSGIGYQGFPKACCTSVNDVVVHGVPNSYVLKNGDYLNIDVVCYKYSNHGDTSAMVMLGDVHPDI